VVSHSPLAQLHMWISFSFCQKNFSHTHKPTCPNLTFYKNVPAAIAVCLSSQIVFPVIHYWDQLQMT
jgi:hypothetical protein